MVRFFGAFAQAMGTGVLCIALVLGAVSQVQAQVDEWCCTLTGKTFRTYRQAVAACDGVAGAVSKGTCSDEWKCEWDRAICVENDDNPCPSAFPVCKEIRRKTCSCKAR